MVITVEEARAYSRDYESTDEEMAALIEVAESMIDDGIRDGFDRESPPSEDARQAAGDGSGRLSGSHGGGGQFHALSDPEPEDAARYKDVSKLDTSGAGEV